MNLKKNIFANDISCLLKKLITKYCTTYFHIYNLPQNPFFKPFLLKNFRIKVRVSRGGPVAQLYSTKMAIAKGNVA